jgi:hypothetical protein
VAPWHVDNTIVSVVADNRDIVHRDVWVARWYQL